MAALSGLGLLPGRPPYEAKQQAQNALTHAQEAITVKRLMEFRIRTEVPIQVQAVAIAASSMVTGIDGEARCPSTWESAHAALSKPGLFLDSLRRFPLVVDAGLLPVENILAAREALESCAADLSGEVFAQQLRSWILAAWQYCELAQPPVQGVMEDESVTPQSLRVTIIKATHLKHLNFTGDAPWVKCEVKHTDRREAPSMCKTRAIKNSLDPEWHETHDLDHWHPGEAIEFTIYDEGVVGSKTEGRVTVPSDTFYPNGFDGSLPIAGIEEAALHIRIEPTVLVAPPPGSATSQAPQVGHSLPASSKARLYPRVEEAASTPQLQPRTQSQPQTQQQQQTQSHPQLLSRPPPTSQPSRSHGAAAASTPQSAPEKLLVSIIRANNMKHLNFVGDALWCVCEVKHADRREEPSRCQTESKKGTLDPEWNETHEVDHWHVGEALEFTIYDKGLLGSKTEGSVTMPSDMFYPNGFDGTLPIAGRDQATLHVRVQLAASQKNPRSQPATAAGRSPVGTKQGRTVQVRSSMPSTGAARSASPPTSVAAAGSRRTATAARSPPARMGGAAAARSPPARDSQSGGITRGARANGVVPVGGPGRAMGGAAGGASPGRAGAYPAQQRTSVEDMRAKLEQVKRETREMRAMETQIKASMKREEEKIRKSEKQQDVKELMSWRQEQRKAGLEHAAARARENKRLDLEESRHYQETKRANKQVEKEAETQIVKEDYLDTKENSSWRVEEVKARIPAERRLVVESNLEKHRVFAEYKLETQSYEEAEQREARAAFESQEMSHMMLLAKQQKELALESLELTRGRQHDAVPPRTHLPARPAGRAELM